MPPLIGHNFHTFIRRTQSTRKPEVLVGGRFGSIHIKLSMVYDYVSS